MIKRIGKKLSYALASLVLITAQMTPFFVFTGKVGALDTGSASSPTATGSNHNDWTNPSNAYAADGVYATESTESDDQSFENFNLTVPANAIIEGIEVGIKGFSSDSSGCEIQPRLYSTSAATHSTRRTRSVNGTNTQYTLGSASDLWGTSWTPSDFSNANFHAEVQFDDGNGNNCDNATFSLDHITVKVYYSLPTPKPDLVATKTNNVSGSATINQSFTWMIRVQNNGEATANFANGNEFLRDNRASTGVSAYGVASVTSSGGATGTVSCATSGTLNRDLVCTANGSVSIPVGAYFDVVYSVTPNAIGSLSNPRSGGTCSVNAGTAPIAETTTGNNACSNTVTVNELPPVLNPALTQACGLDIALVIDNSTSISESQMNSMKSAMTSFTTAFVGTPTEFSVTRFATSASISQAFTDDISAVNAAINAVPVGGGFTNWEDGLLKAQSTLTNRVANPDLVIFASDGDPTTSNTVGGTDTNQPNAHLSPAVTVANSIKTNGARMLVLGIGSPTLSRLQAISGPNVNTGDVLTSDVITTDFATLAQDLAEFAAQTCGGTITTTKIVDTDGKLDSTDDQSYASGWSFDVNGTVSNPDLAMTDTNGQTIAVEVEPGVYSVTETPKAGYRVVKATCKIGDTPVGSWQSGNTVSDISVTANDIVSCEFINGPSNGTLIVEKIVHDYYGGTATPDDFWFKVDGGSSIQFNANGHNELSLEAGTYDVVEDTAQGYEATYNNCTDVYVPAGGTATCVITNTPIAPTLTLIKLVTNNSGGSTIASAWTLIAQAGTSDPVINEQGAIVPDSDNKKAQTSTVSVSAGIFYTLSESGPGGYTPGAWSCDGGTLDDGAVMLALDTSVTCTIVNDDDAPMLEVGKRVINDNSGTELSEDFNLYVNGVLLTDARKGGGDISDNGIWYLHADTKANTVYTITEDQKTGYENTNLECIDLDTQAIVSHPITLGLGQRVSCTLTNDDIPNPSLSVEKYGPETAFEGETVTYTIFVTNDGDVNLTNVDVEDALIEEGVDFSFSYGDDDNVLEIGETWVYTATYTIPENTTENVINTVNVCADMYEKYAEWTDMRQMSVLMNEEIVRDACGSASHELDVLIPSIEVVKTGPASAAAGSTVRYTFTVTNTGEVSLSEISLKDNKLILPGQVVVESKSINNDDILDIGEVWIFTGDYTIPQNQVAPVVNTVEACGSYNLRQVEQESEDARSAAVAPSVEICAEDSHTLRIPQVLGSSTTVVPKTPAPAVLATTGTNTTTSVLAGISLIIAAIFVTFLGVKTTTSSDK